MAKKSQATKTRSASRTETASAKHSGKETDKTPARSAHPLRETVEQIVFAFVLAFLFRTFEAEAFVIPTGSMAPTLMGRHNDLECPKCHYRYSVNASREEDVAQAGPDFRRDGQVINATCPLCRYSMDVDPESPRGEEYIAFNGDRILVAKFPYDVIEPKRWDVTVFHYPGDAKMNYIKRLVGLPGETVKISHGDLFTKADKAEKFKIERKPPAKIQAMLQIVYDNDFVVDDMTKNGWPLRWQPATKDTHWKTDEGGRAFHIDSSPNAQWLRYQHLLPTPDDWTALEAGTSLPEKPRPQLIRDFYAYNAGVIRSRGMLPRSLGLHWVGDLSLEAQVEVKNNSGQVLLDLVEGGRHFTCAIDVSNGDAQLSADGVKDFQPRAKTIVAGPGTYELQFANIDDQLLLWVNGSLVEFDKPTTYPSETSYPTQADLAPAGIGSRGAKIAVSHIKLSRDIYYIADTSATGSGLGDLITDYSFNSQTARMDPWELVAFFSSPDQWQSLRPGGVNQLREVEFPLKADQYFVLGDNSPCSKDARLWADRADERYGSYVTRDLLIGKALYIYWPHAWPAKYSVAIPAFGNEIRVPFWPNFKRMRLVR